MKPSAVLDKPAGRDPNGARLVIDAGYARYITGGAAKAGYDLEHILGRAGIARHLLQKQGSRLSQDQFARLLTALTHVTRDELWSLGGRPVKPGTFRTMCTLIARCKTLREAIRAGCQYYHVVADDFTVRLSEDGREACIWITNTIPDSDNRRAINGTLIFFTYGLLCWLAGKKLPLRAVHNAFSRETFSAAVEPVFQAPVLYDRDRCELRFDPEILDLPVMLKEDSLKHFLSSMPSALLLRYRDERDFAERVRNILRCNLHRSLSLDEVAAALAVAPQTLRRRLQAANVAGFQDLKDDVRRDAAIQLLKNSRLTLVEIAHALGFSELSAFHRAFRRWTGLAPGRYREAHAPAADMAGRA